MSDNDILPVALYALAAGLNPLPPRQDGTKAPDAHEWASRQTTMATEAEVRAMYANGRTGLGLVCGRVSGGLELFEFEGRAVEAGILTAFVDAAKGCGLGELVERIATGYTDKSPSGGLHWLIRTARPVTTKLAAGPDHLPLIETKGEGGYVITAPSHGSVHPTGKPWELIAGGFATIARITAEEQADLHRLAATFDQTPRSPVTTQVATGGEPTRGSSTWEVLPGEDYNARATWPEVLEPHGWQRLFSSRGNQHWRRPGKEHGTSATVNEDGAGTLFVFTSSTPFDPRTGYSRFGAYAVLNHGGDYKAAAKDLEEQGYGRRADPEDGEEDPPEDGADRQPARAKRRRSERAPSNDSPAPVRLVVGRLASSVEPRPVRWAYANRVPLGATTLVAGREGVSKGVFVYDLTARWTRGQLDGDLKGQAVDVAILSLEDDPERVLLPRLMAAGADLDRVHILGISEDGHDGTLVFPDDVGRLSVWMAAKGPRVLCIDVPNSFMAEGFDAHKDHDVRQAVAGPLTRLAAALDVAVVLIVHLNRAPTTVVLDRIAGSLGFSRAARAVLAIVENPDDQTERLAVLAKSNLGRVEVPAIRYRVEGVDVDTPSGPASAGRVVHLGETDAFTAGNALRAADPEERTARVEAADWLADLLGAGPVPAAEVKSMATKAGMAWATVRRAKDEVGVESRRWGRPGEEGGWCWALAAEPEGAHETPKMPTYNNVSTFGSGEHLREIEHWVGGAAGGDCPACGEQVWSHFAHGFVPPGHPVPEVFYCGEACCPRCRVEVGP